MKIGIIGNGFVGSAIMQGFILHTDDMMIYDKDSKRSTHRLEELALQCDVVFVCVPTPMYESGECDLSIVENVVDEFMSFVSRKQTLVIKSTVVPGTTEKLAKKYEDNPYVSFVFNPEFLTERKARLDFINTSRIVLGSDNEVALQQVEDLYKLRFPYTKIIKTDFGTAQLIKYMANCFFTTKVSFMNEMHQICKAIDGDFGFGGKCFPKDLNAMIKRSEELGVNPTVMKAAWEKNKEIRKDLDWYDIPGAVSKGGSD